MHKLQVVIDVIFGNVDVDPIPQRPSEMALEKEKAFEGNRRKMENLKEARLGLVSRHARLGEPLQKQYFRTLL